MNFFLPQSQERNFDSGPEFWHPRDLAQFFFTTCWKTQKHVYTGTLQDQVLAYWRYIFCQYLAVILMYLYTVFFTIFYHYNVRLKHFFPSLYTHIHAALLTIISSFNSPKICTFDACHILIYIYNHAVYIYLF